MTGAVLLGGSRADAGNGLLWATVQSSASTTAQVLVDGSLTAVTANLPGNLRHGLQAGSRVLVFTVGAALYVLTDVAPAGANPTTILYFPYSTGFASGSWVGPLSLTTGSEPVHTYTADAVTHTSGTGVCTLTRTGLYTVTAVYGFLSGGTGGNERALYMKLNSGTPGSSADYRDTGTMVAASAGYTHCRIETSFRANAGEYVSFYGYQNSGSSVIAGGNVSGAYNAPMTIEYKGGW